MSFSIAAFEKPIQEAVCSVIETMGQLKLEPQAAKLSSCSQMQSSRGDISGVIAVSAEKLSGTMALIFERSLILKLYSNILGGSPVNEIDSDVRDAVMEMTNVIFGNAKRDINKLGFDIQPALPSVVEGPQHKVHHSPKGECLCLSFSSEAGSLFVEFSAHQ